MKTVTFVTSNDTKFQHAKRATDELGIQLERVNMHLDELQSEHGEEIARHKAEQAYASLQQPIVITDDTWIIPGLKGFPGPYMKSMNEWFTPEDWLRLTLPLNDRRIILSQHAVYQDAHGQHYINQAIDGLLLSEIRGQHKHSHLTIASFDGGQTSAAERVAAGKSAIQEAPKIWRSIAELIADND